MSREVRGPETGGSLPRAADSGNQLVVLVVMALLLVVSPLAMAVAVPVVFLVLRQRRWHWWEVALSAALVTAVAAFVVKVSTGSVIEFHFGGWFEAWTAYFSTDGATATMWATAIARTAVIAIPAGVVAGAAYVGWAEFTSGRAEFHPVEQRRRAVTEHRNERAVNKRLADPQAAELCRGLPLGVLRGGDLGEKWTDHGYVVPPVGSFPAMGLLGESGSGKTVTAERMVQLWARAGRKVIFADFKGTDPELATRIVAAYKSARPDAACAFWPAQPLDMWRGDPVEITNRMLCVQDFTEPYYKGVAETAVRLAMKAPDVDNTGPVRDSESFMARLDIDYLKRAYEGHPKAPIVAKLAADPKALTGVVLRYDGFFSALAGRFDHGFSFEDCDLAVLSVATLAARSDAMAVARMVLTDFGAYCTSRKSRIGEDVTFIVDEFSAVTEAAPQVIDLAERVRDVGGQVVVSAQSYEGLGDTDDQRRRMVSALVPGGLVVHRLSDPDEVLSAAGTVRAIEQSWTTDTLGTAGMGTAKIAHKMKIDPDAVRQARTGEAWVIQAGKAAHLQVIRSAIPDEVLDDAAALVRRAHRQGLDDLAVGARAEVQPWWEVPALPPPRLELEAGGLAELVGGSEPPRALPPVPKYEGPDPRLVLAIAAYVRAGELSRAYKIAVETEGIDDPKDYVDDLVARRRSEIERVKAKRRSSGRNSPGGTRGRQRPAQPS